jgi:hypothetical protein
MIPHKNRGLFVDSIVVLVSLLLLDVFKADTPVPTVVEEPSFGTTTCFVRSTNFDRDCGGCGCKELRWIFSDRRSLLCCLQFFMHNPIHTISTRRKITTTGFHRHRDMYSTIL